MATLVIDTYQFVEKLRSSGVAEPQAKAIVEGIRDIGLGHVASKADLGELRADIHQLRILTKNDILEVKNDLFKWIIPMMLGQTGLIVALVKPL